MTNPTADAAKLLHYAKHHMGCPKWGPSATAASKCECGLDDLADAVTRPQPARPAGEPDFKELAREYHRTVAQDVNWYLSQVAEFGRRMYRLGLAARPKVEDAERAK